MKRHKIAHDTVFMKRPRIVCGRGSAPDPAGGAYDALPDLLVGWNGEGDAPPLLIPLPRCL